MKFAKSGAKIDTITMPASNIEITASYNANSVKTYQLTTSDALGTINRQLAEGVTTTISASEKADDDNKQFRFLSWEGAIGNIEDANSQSTLFAIFDCN